MTQQKFNITQLAKRFGLDRVTVAGRLEAADVPWVRGKKQEKLYDLEAAAAVIVTEADENYDQARARKVTIEADLKQLELDRERGSVVDVKTIREDIQRIMQRLFQRLAVQQPKELAQALFKSQSAPQAETILRKATSKVFEDLRRDHEKYLGEVE